LRLEFGAAFATTLAAIDDLLGSSVHVSIKKLVDTRLLRNSIGIETPRPDAYGTHAPNLIGMHLGGDGNHASSRRWLFILVNYGLPAAQSRQLRTS
jgi:hypothetical protein